MNFHRARQLLTRLPPARALRMVISEGARAMLDPDARPTHAQFGEDLAISFILGVRSPGFYVDVGCNHPTKGSNTFDLYSRGWRGIAIDGNPDLVNEYRRCRPFDEAVCAVVSDVEREASFSIAAVNQLSTVSEAFEREVVGAENVVRRLRVRTRTLESILEEHEAPRNIDVLSVDVEGHDVEVLRSLDMDRFRPYLVVVEMHGFDLERPGDDQTFRVLKDRGYKIVGYSGLTGYFVDQRDAAG